MIKGLNRLQAKLENLKKIDVTPIVENATARVRDEARKNVKVGTGELQNSITYSIKEKGSIVQGTIFSNKEHAVFVEFGTGPVGERNHTGISPDIKPMYTPHGWTYYMKDGSYNAWKLSFKKDGTINKAETKRNNTSGFVYTEGQPARPFLYPALHNNRDKISKFIMSQIKKKLKEV